MLTLRYCNSPKPILPCIPQWLSLSYLTLCRFLPQKCLILFHKDEFIYMFAKSIMIFQHCPVSGRCDLNTKMSLCCYCVSERREIAFLPQDRMTRNNNIFLKPASTKDLSSYLPTSQRLLALKLFSDCVRHETNIGIQAWPLIFAWIFFWDLFCCYRKSFIRAFTMKLLKVWELFHSKWLVLRFWSWFVLFVTFHCLIDYQPLMPHLSQFSETLCWFFLCSWASW